MKLFGWTQHPGLMMARRGGACIAGLLMFFLSAGGALPAVPLAQPMQAGLRQSVLNHAGTVRIPFVANQGQIPDPAVRFYARTFGGTVYVLQSGDVVYVLPKHEDNAECGMRIAESGTRNFPSASGVKGPPRLGRDELVCHAEKSKIKNYTSDNLQSAIRNPQLSGWAVLRESFLDARRPAPVGGRPAASVVHCFLGNDPARWQSNLPSFEKVILGEIYDGIQLSLRAHGNNVEKIFTVAPGADPRQIRVSLAGACGTADAAGLAVNAQGELEVMTALGVVRFSAPVAWQTDADGRDMPVSIAYAVADDTFSFALGAYDPARPLVIDPMLSSTFVGGSGGDRVLAVAVEGGSSNILVAGYTDSLNFPTNAAAYGSLSGGRDIFVSKFDFYMTNLLVSTYIGGASNDVANAIALDANSNVFVAGYTYSSNFPAAGNTYNGAIDAVVVKFDSDLANPASTYLGGSGADAAQALVVDLADCVFVAGYTESTNFPVTGAGYSTNYSGARDGFVALFDNVLAISACTYLGGTAEDAIQALALSRSTNVYVAGYTKSTDFPVAATNSVFTNAFCTNLTGVCDAFVSRLNATLTNLDITSYLGGTNQDVATTLGLDPATNVYVAGYTYSGNFPMTAAQAQTNLGGSCDAFISSLNVTMSTLRASTYLGGSGVDRANGMAMAVNIVTNTTNIIIVGYTASTDFPVTANAYDRTYNGAGDAFVTLLTSPLTNFYAATYLGGTSEDQGQAAAVAMGSNSVIAVGYTASSDYPISDATYGTRYNGGAYDGFVSRLAASLTYGTKKWEVPTGIIYSSPCMGPDGTLYMGSGNNLLYAINSKGTTNWTYPMRFIGTQYASPMITTNGIVYIGGDTNSLLGLNATNGVVIHSNNFGYVASCAAVDAEGYIYVANCVGVAGVRTFSQLTTDLITTNRTYFMGGDIYSSPALGTNDDVYIGSSALGFLCLNRSSGETNGLVTDGAGNFQSSPAIGTNGLIYVGSTFSNVFAVTPNGHTNQQWAAMGAVYGSPVIDTNGIVYVGSANRFYALDSTSGETQRVWNLSGGIGPANAAAIGADGTVYVGSGNVLYSLNPVDGTTNWSFSLESSCGASSPLIGMDGTIYIGSAAGRFYAIYGPTPMDVNAPWPKFHHDMMNSGQYGFDTAPRPPASVTATKGTDAYTNSVLVTWNSVQYAACYEIYRSTTNASSSAPKIASTWRTNYLDNIDVNLGRVYYYWIKTKAPLGVSGFSDPAEGGTLPLAPTGLSASKGEQDGYTNLVHVAWSNSIGAAGYQVWRSETDATNAAGQIALTAVTNYNDADITRSVGYYYWIKATNTFGISGFSSNDYGGTPPLPPATVAAGKGTSVDYLPVTWSASFGADMYVVYSNITDDVESSGSVTNTAGLSFYHYATDPSFHYYYWVRATNEFGHGEYSASDWGYRALSPPLSIYASDGVYTTQVHVSWVVSDTNYTTAHQVYRSRTNATNTAVMLIETAYTAPTMTNYYDLGIVRGPIYYYWVCAKNAYGTSDFSQVDSGGTGPLPPSGIVASDGDYTDKVLVSWIASPFASTYNIYQSLDNNTANASLVGTVSGSLTTFDDTTAIPGAMCYYWVRSVSPYGASVFSGSDYGWRALSPPLSIVASDGTSTSYVSIVWSLSAGASAYELWRGTDTNSAGASKLQNSVATNVYQDAGTVAGTVYYYWVKARTAELISGLSASDSGYRAIGQVDIGVSDCVFLPPVMAIGGYPGAVSFRLANYGNQAMTEPYNAWVMSEFYLSANPVFGDDDDVWIGVYSNSVPLSVNTSAGVALPAAMRRNLTIPTLPLGCYYVFVHVRHCLPSAWEDPVPGNNTALRLGETITISEQAAAPTALNDYDGDGRAEMAVYHESDGRWYIRTVAGTYIVYGDIWGEPGYQPVVGDYDDSGKADLAVYHEASGYWFIRSATGLIMVWRHWWGAPGYQPVPGDYDGDGKSDLAVYNEDTGYWFIQSAAGLSANLSDESVAVEKTEALAKAGNTIAWAEWWGAPGYQPVSGDYDGDSKSDLAVYHAADGRWYIRTLAGTTIAWATWWGGEDYQAVPGDYDGDGISDMAVYDKPSGYWFIQSVSGVRIAWGEYWGLPDYTPVPGDYDGDGIYDLAVYNEADGLWYIRTLAGITILYGESWGAPGYKPVSNLP